VIGGTSVPANEVLLLSLASANRDPSQFAAPDVFDLHRTDHQGHVAFGHGIHYCIGAPLARLEARIAFPKLLASCADIALDKAAEPQWRVGLPSRGVTSLPVTFTPVDTLGPTSPTS
jgi:cytochrome P450